MNGVTLLECDYLATAADQNWMIVGVGDFNGDGKPDILWRNTSTGQNAVWYMNGVTLIGVDSANSSHQNWIIVGVGDFNGDGKPDILWRNTTTGQNAVWYMNGVTLIGVDYLTTAADQSWIIV